MPLTKLKPAQFKPPKEIVVTWNTFRKGLNMLMRESEIDGSEMVQAYNLLLIGSGIPTKRWGSQEYFLSGATGYGRGIIPVKSNAGTIEVLSMTDWGILVKKNGASYTPITGASWASGYNLEGAQLGNRVYLVNGQREFVRYDFSSLAGFATLSIPTGLTVSNWSGATGTTTYSWKITAMSNVGETLGCTPISLASLPQSLSDTLIRLSWTAVSAASGVLTGYNIYRGNLGDEVWIGGVDNTSTLFWDYGMPSGDPFRISPVADTTGGPIAKYILRFQDRLVLAGMPNEPTKILISARYPQHERFDWYAGGGGILIEPDSGEEITGLATYYQTSSQTSQTIIVFKENSVWEVRLSEVQFGDTVLLNPVYRLLTASQGCSSHRSIKAVENDIMFSNLKGIYMLRNEPQLQNVINANEISAKIRPFFEGLTNADLTSAAAIYADKKYILSFPVSKKSIVFDRERLCFLGPWTTPYGINHWASYIDESGIERWMAVDASDSYVSEFRKTYTNDKGTAYKTIFRSRKEDFGDWTLFKTVNELFALFRNVVGSVNVNIYLEERSGQTITAKGFTLTSSVSTSGFGTDLFGLFGFGLSGNDAHISSDETPKRAFIYKNARTIQVEITTTGKTDNYELLSLKSIAIPQARGNAPSSWAV